MAILEDKEEYDKQLKKLASMFVDNFNRYADAENSEIFPAIIDLNVKNSESISKLNQKAIKGGVGTILMIPQQKPIYNKLHLAYNLTKEKQIDLMVAVEAIHEGKLTDIHILVDKGAKAIFLNSDEDMNLIKRVFQYAEMLKVPIFINANNKSLLGDGQMNESKKAYSLGLEGIPNYVESVEVAKILEFAKNFDAKIFELHENFRSSRKVIEASSKIMPIADKKLLANTVYEGLFELIKCTDEKRESECVVDKVKELLNLGLHPEIEGKITLNKMAVLARNKYVFKNLEKILDEEKIPFYYKMTPGAIKFETDIMRIFDMKLRIKINPMDILHKLQVDQLETNIADTSIIKKIDILIDELTEDGENFKKVISELKNYLMEENFEDDLKKMIIDDIDELLEHWVKYAITNERKSLKQFRNYMALGKTATLHDEQGITLSTVHTMKGQEYDIVFIIGADDGTFPDYRAIKKGGIELEQEKNNLYVAFTRAKRFLYVSYPQMRMMPWGDYKSRNISRFLKDFDEFDKHNNSTK